MDDFEYQLQQEQFEREQKQKALQAAAAVHQDHPGLETSPDDAEAAHASNSTGGASSATYSTTYVDPNDGTAYEWDFEKRAWFPKIDENFIATYQAGYGEHKLDLSQPSLPPAEAIHQAASIGTSDKNTDTAATNKKAAISKEEWKEKQKQRKREKRKLEAERQKNAKWFDIDETHNTNVYVSGLPLDYTDQEFEELMSKCGLVARELDNKKLKLKLYRDQEGNLKGDGRCCYIKRESVELALNILDGTTVNGHKIKVEQAKFELKGEFDPSKKKRVTAKMKKRMKEQQEKLFSWKPEKIKGERPRSDSTVVLKNMFTLEELDQNPARLFDIEEELKNECQKYGVLRKVVVCDNNPDGVVLLTFNEPAEADDCITMMNYRVWPTNKRQLRAETWDGKSKYKVKEKKEDEQKRLSTWEKFLEGGEGEMPSTTAQTEPKIEADSVKISQDDEPQSSRVTSNVETSSSPELSDEAENSDQEENNDCKETTDR